MQFKLFPVKFISQRTVITFLYQRRAVDVQRKGRLLTMLTYIDLDEQNT